MNIMDIVKEYLEKNNYDGLCLAGECGCELDDLHPCDEFSECEPAYKIKCKQLDNMLSDECEYGYRFCMSVDKNERCEYRNEQNED